MPIAVRYPSVVVPNVQPVFVKFDNIGVVHLHEVLKHLLNFVLFTNIHKRPKINVWPHHINTYLWNTEIIKRAAAHILTSTVLKTFLSWKITSFHTTSTPSSVSMPREALSTPGTFPWLTCRGWQTNIYLKEENTQVLYVFIYLSFYLFKLIR